MPEYNQLVLPTELISTWKELVRIQSITMDYRLHTAIPKIRKLASKNVIHSLLCECELWYFSETYGLWRYIWQNIRKTLKIRRLTSHYFIQIIHFIFVKYQVYLNEDTSLCAHMFSSKKTSRNSTEG